MARGTDIHLSNRFGQILMVTYVDRHCTMNLRNAHQQKLQHPTVSGIAQLMMLRWVITGCKGKALVKCKTLPRNLPPKVKGDRQQNGDPQIWKPWVKTDFFGRKILEEDQEVRFLRPVLGQELSEVNLWPFLCSKVRWLSKCSEDLLFEAFEGVSPFRPISVCHCLL